MVRRDAWDKIPVETRSKLLAIAAEYGKKTSIEVRKMNDDALAQMKKQGLKVVTPANPAEWSAAAEKAYTVIRGKVVPAELFDRVKKLHQEFREQHGTK